VSGSRNAFKGFRLKYKDAWYFTTLEVSSTKTQVLISKSREEIEE